MSDLFTTVKRAYSRTFPLALVFQRRLILYWWQNAQ